MEKVSEPFLARAVSVSSEAAVVGDSPHFVLMFPETLGLNDIIQKRAGVVTSGLVISWICCRLGCCCKHVWEPAVMHDWSRAWGKSRANAKNLSWSNPWGCGTGFPGRCRVDLGRLWDVHSRLPFQVLPKSRKFKSYARFINFEMTNLKAGNDVNKAVRARS